MSRAALDPDVLNALLGAFPSKDVLTDPAECMTYAYDNSRLIAMPQAVAFASDADQIVECVRICRQHSIALTVRGRGTNTTGATVPVAGGLVLSTERMNRILQISPGDRLIECESGCLNADVQKAAAAHGLFWAPDPTSAEYSTVGGNLACGAGGPRAVKYGTARDNVLGLDVIAGTGEILRTGCRTTKGVVGYDLTRLMIGSEGTLGIITRASLKLLPRPSGLRTLRALYRNVGAAIDAVARIMGQPAVPCALEFFDADALQLAQQWKDCGIPPQAGAMLLIDVDGEEPGLDADAQAIAAAARCANTLDLRVAVDESERADLWAARKALSPSLRKLAPRKVNEDVVVPVTHLARLVEGLQGLSRRHGIRIVTFGHAGNGNLHVNLLADPSDPAQNIAIGHCLNDVFTLVLELDGTLSGEHGVGIVKREFVAREVSAQSLDVMHGLKRLFDPDGILNPGKTLPGRDESEPT